MSRISEEGEKRNVRNPKKYRNTDMQNGNRIARITNQREEVFLSGER